MTSFIHISLHLVCQSNVYLCQYNSHPRLPYISVFQVFSLGAISSVFNISKSIIKKKELFHFWPVLHSVMAEVEKHCRCQVVLNFWTAWKHHTETALFFLVAPQIIVTTCCLFFSFLLLQFISTLLLLTVFRQQISSARVMVIFHKLLFLPTGCCGHGVCKEHVWTPQEGVPHWGHHWMVS